ncbi:hypothetical protein IG631_02269 [Alternaria alternata]|nr:hypothetical protein IG631_02269 [Alternaria alternata]
MGICVVMVGSVCAEEAAAGRAFWRGIAARVGPWACGCGDRRQWRRRQRGKWAVVGLGGYARAVAGNPSA